MTESDKEFERQMAIARERMDKHEVALSVLAQGENSPCLTDDFRAQLAEADKQLERYKTAKRL